MTDDPERRRNWRTNWLSSIQEFADEEVQRRMWLDTTNINPHWSYVEFFCCYFDDLGLSDGYGWAIQEAFVTNEEVTAVAGFHRVANAYSSPTDNYDHKAILCDPKWAEVVAAAKQAQGRLLGLIEDPHERGFLMEP
jgi:hypothetical protein